MKTTNLLRKHLARRITAAAALLAGIACALGLISASASAAVANTAVFVGNYRAVVNAGAIAQVPVQLRGQNGHNPSFPIAGATLHVRCWRRTTGGFVEADFLRKTVVTDGNGQATISFRMPSKLRNNSGREISTVVSMSVVFNGGGSLNGGDENRAINIRVGP